MLSPSPNGPPFFFRISFFSRVPAFRASLRSSPCARDPYFFFFLAFKLLDCSPPGHFSLFLGAGPPDTMILTPPGDVVWGCFFLFFFSFSFVFFFKTVLSLDPCCFPGLVSPPFHVPLRHVPMRVDSRVPYPGCSSREVSRRRGPWSTHFFSIPFVIRVGLCRLVQPILALLDTSPCPRLAGLRIGACPTMACTHLIVCRIFPPVFYAPPPPEGPFLMLSASPRLCEVFVSFSA